VENFFVSRVTGKVKSQKGNVRIRGRTNFKHGQYEALGGGILKQKVRDQGYTFNLFLRINVLSGFIIHEL